MFASLVIVPPIADLEAAGIHEDDPPARGPAVVGRVITVDQLLALGA